MPDEPMLSDHEVHDRLMQASNALPDPEQCKSVQAQTAAATAMQLLTVLQMGLLAATEPNDP